MGATPTVAVLAVARTAVRPVDGELAGWNPVVLAGVVGREALERAGLADDDLDEVVVGCADPVGACGGDAARAIVLAAGWPVGVGGHVVDRGETSGAAAVQAAAASIRAGQARTVLVVGLGLCSVVPPGAAALNRTYGAPWGGVAERFADAGGLLPGPRLSERAAEAAGIGRDELDAAAEESRRRRAEAGASPAIVAVAARPGDAAARGVYRGDPVAADVLRDWGDTAELPPAFDDDGLLTAATFAPPADAVAAVLLQAVEARLQPGEASTGAIAVLADPGAAGETQAAEKQTAVPDAQPPGTTAVLAGTSTAGETRADETQPPRGGDPPRALRSTGAAGVAQAHAAPLATVAGMARAAETQPPRGGDPPGALRSTGAAGVAQAHAAPLATVAGMARAAGDPFDPVGNVAVAVGRALTEAGVELGAVDDIAVVEHDATTVMLVARALVIDADGINCAGGAVATGSAGAAEELRMITDGLADPGTGRLLLTISAGPTGSAAIVWRTDI